MAAIDNFRTNLATVFKVGLAKKSVVAAKAKTSRAYIDQVLKGEREPSVSRSEDIGLAAGFTFDHIFAPPKQFASKLASSRRVAS